MATTNPITGDAIQTKGFSKEYDTNFDKVDYSVKLEVQEEQKKSDLEAEKAQFLEMWKLSGEEGEKVWQEKLKMMNRQHIDGLPYVREDVKPYKSMITGEFIEGKKAHREHLKRHNCVEAADMPLKNPERPKDNLKEQIARQVYEKLRY